MTARDSTIGWGEWPAWLDTAAHTPACRGHDPNLWFPEPRAPDAHQRSARAKELCAVCPLLDTCRDWAYAQPPHLLAGIWGGTTQRERTRHHAAIREGPSRQPPQFRKIRQPEGAQ